MANFPFASVVDWRLMPSRSLISMIAFAIAAPLAAVPFTVSETVLLLLPPLLPPQPAGSVVVARPSASPREAPIILFIEVLLLPGSRSSHSQLVRQIRSAGHALEFPRGGSDRGLARPER